MQRQRETDLWEWLSSKLFNVIETSIDEIQNPVRGEEHQKSSEERNSEDCPYSFGYLKTLPKKDPIPDECLICVKVMECMNRYAT